MIDPQVVRSMKQDLQAHPEMLRLIVKQVEEDNPEWFRLLYPRRYVDLNGYPSPKIIAAYLCLVLRSVRAQEPEMLASGPRAHRMLLPAIWHMIPKRMPYLFLAPHLAEAIKRTDFAGEINWQELKLPYEKGALVIPPGVLTHPTDGDCAALFWSRGAAHELITPPPAMQGDDFPHLEAANGGFTIVMLCAQSGMWYDMGLSGDKPLLTLKNLFYAGPGEAPPSFTTDPFTQLVDDGDHEQDKAFIDRAGVLLFGTMLALQARPQLLERERLERTVKDRRNGGSKEFWTPNIIGRNYRLPAASAGGTHASPRMHWRRGHIRQQPFGPGRMERKTIWLEPMLVSALTDKNEEALQD